MSKKLISLLLTIILILGTSNILVFAEEDPNLLYNKDGVTIKLKAQDTIDPERDKAIPMRSGGIDGKAQLDSITIYNQSTYAKRLPDRYYYRTVGYHAALLNEDMLPIVDDGLIPSNMFGVPIDDEVAVDVSVLVAYLYGLIDDPGLAIEQNIRGLVDTKYFNSNDIRTEEIRNMWKLIDSRFGDAGYSKPYVTSLTISRDRLIKELDLEGREHILDEAQYLLWAGEIEYYKSNLDASEGPALDASRTKIMYNPARERLVSYFNIPPRYEDAGLRGDIESRMQLINLHTGDVRIIVLQDPPDLIVDKIEPGVAETKPGATHTGKVAVRRAAEPGNTEALNTTLYLTVANGKITGESDIPVSLKPGESREIPFTWTAGNDDSKDVVMVAEINPAKLGNKRLMETNYSNNKAQATVNMAGNVDLSIKLGSWMDALFANETQPYSVQVFNSSDKAITTDIVWRFAGKQVRKASITIPAQGSILDSTNLTMPNIAEGSNALLEVEVNPSRNRPAKEVTFANNKITQRIVCLGLDEDSQMGEGNPHLTR